MHTLRARRTTLLSCLLVASLATLTAACDGSSTAEDPPTTASYSTSASASDESPSASTGPSIDPAHAVHAPGKRTGQLQPADIIVNGSQTIDKATVKAIRRLDGVQDVEVISLAQTVIENQALRVAAVDPATYRNYTPTIVANTQDVWNRVADGELALRKTLQKKVPQDKQGFLALGSTKDAAPIHIGAYAPLSVQVDAVVNKTWIKPLHMTPGNALLIRTGTTAPLTLRKPIKQIVGRDNSVQMVDAVARFGLDPSAVQTAVVVGTIADAVGVFRYTVLGGGKIAPDPDWVASHITTVTVPILGNVTCNKLIFPQLKAALRDVLAQGLADKIHRSEYAGCYYPRFIAGSTTLSNHAFGLALDLNVPGNQRGTVGEMDRAVVAIFERFGFTWGGRWRYTDPMHFEANAIVDVR
jgi:hypothetical protein